MPCTSLVEVVAVALNVADDGKEAAEIIESLFARKILNWCPDAPGKRVHTPRMDELVETIIAGTGPITMILSIEPRPWYRLGALN